MKYILYKQSGEIICNLVCEESDLPTNIKNNNAFAAIEGSVTDTSIVFVKDKKVVPLPNKLETFATFDYVKHTWVSDTAAYAEAIQIERSKLLSESDWTQLTDIPLVTKSLWQPYRQALRDITEQRGYPINVIWPIKPNT